jgi:hypothetical protein
MDSKCLWELKITSLCQNTENGPECHVVARNYDMYTKSGPECHVVARKAIIERNRGPESHAMARKATSVYHKWPGMPCRGPECHALVARNAIRNIYIYIVSLYVCLILEIFIFVFQLKYEEHVRLS